MWKTAHSKAEVQRTYIALAAAMLGRIMYAVKQDWTPHFFIGTFAEILYQLYNYLFMPFPFAGLLLAMITYVVNMARACCDRDIVLALLSVIALELAFYVTAPVIGEIGIVKVRIILNMLSTGSPLKYPV